MVKMLVAWGSVSLLAALAACSDDTVKPPPKDLAVDMPMTPDKPRREAGKDVGKDVVSTEAAPAQITSALILAQLTGRTSWGPDPGGAPPTTLLGFRVEFPDPAVKPDYDDLVCQAWKWDGTGAMKRNDMDAGKVTVSGHSTSLWVDPAVLPPSPKPLPQNLEFTRAAVGTSGYNQYGWPLTAPIVALLSPAMDASSTMTFEAAGGKDVGAFKVDGIKLLDQLKPKAPTDLNQIDPANFTVAWETTTAPVVGILIKGNLKDNSKMFYIACSVLAGTVTSKAIPAGALAVIPTPTATNPLVITTGMMAVNVKGGAATWGTYRVGVGSGTFGVSCRTPAGQCPQPPKPDAGVPKG